MQWKIVNNSMFMIQVMSIMSVTIKLLLEDSTLSKPWNEAVMLQFTLLRDWSSTTCWMKHFDHLRRVQLHAKSALRWKAEWQPKKSYLDISMAVQICLSLLPVSVKMNLEVHQGKHHFFSLLHAFPFWWEIVNARLLLLSPIKIPFH